MIYLKQKKCASLLKKSIIKMYSSAPESNCMDMAKQNGVIKAIRNQIKISEEGKKSSGNNNIINPKNPNIIPKIPINERRSILNSIPRR